MKLTKLTKQKTTILFIMFLMFGCKSEAFNPNEQTEQKPNVVFILADDLGWVDLACMGSTFYETPNIDKLAEKGIKFMNAYSASPVCSPTRASILTGMWPSRAGIDGAVCHLENETFEATIDAVASPNKRLVLPKSATRLKLEYKTIAESFKDAGYITAHIGKWHLGKEPYDPLRQGFDIDIPHTHAPGPLVNGYFTPWPTYPNQGATGDHLEDRMAEEAVQFIKNNKDRPFLLHYWAFSVHGPWNTKQELIDKYKNKIDMSNPQHNPAYAGMVEVFDDAVGLLVQTLDEEGIADNTIVIFYSDNGGYAWASDKYVHEEYKEVELTSNSPLRGGKATIYEGGIRVPLIIKWPGKITEGIVNTNSIVSSVDIYPTLLDMAGISSVNGQVSDGESILPAIMGGTIIRDENFCHFPLEVSFSGCSPASSIRKGDWKLIRRYHFNRDLSHHYELYNLKSDIGETINLADSNLDKKVELEKLLNQYIENTGAVVPIPNPNYDVSAAQIKNARMRAARRKR
jgi:arylsulfatase A-like enzyme